MLSAMVVLEYVCWAIFAASAGLLLASLPFVFRPERRQTGKRMAIWGAILMPLSGFSAVFFALMSIGG